MVTLAAQDSPPASDIDTVIARVQSWSRRKKHLFTEHHIRTAWDQLHTEGWLPATDDTLQGV